MKAPSQWFITSRAPSFEGRNDLELNSRSEPMTIEDAQAWVNKEDAAVCLRCAPPLSEQAGRRSRYMRAGISPAACA